jgi:hypothetical protein
MTAMALTLSQTTILEVKQTAKQHVAGGNRRVNFALSVLGQCVDFMGGRIVEKLNIRFERDLVRIRGVISVLPDLDPARVIDPQNELARDFAELQRQIHEFHGKALKARDDIKLRRTRAAFRVCVELSAALHETVGELKKAIAEHDSKASMSDHVRRLMADLKRTDDVPAGRSAELAGLMRKLPKRPAEDRTNDPAPL